MKYLNKIKNSIERKANSKSYFWKTLNYLIVLTWRFKSILLWKKYQFPDKIFKTKKFKLVDSSDLEIHSLLGHKYLKMYLLAIKSLLRFYDNLKLVVHDDGTLSENDKKILNEHLLGIKIIDRQKADTKINQLLENYPMARDFRNKNIMFSQLLDYALLAETNKIVSFDADIIFFKKPEQFINWCQSSESILISNYEDFSIYMDETIKSWEVDYQKNFNCGFFCFYRNLIDLDKIEQILAKVERSDFCTPQFILAVLIKIEGFPFEFFDPEKYQTKKSIQEVAPIFRHYLSHSGIYNKYLQDYNNVLKELIV